MGKFLNSSERWLSSVLHEFKEIWRSRFGSRFHIAMTNFLNKLFKCYFLNLFWSCDYQSLAWSPLLRLIMFQSKQGNQKEEEIFQMLAAGSVYQEHYIAQHSRTCTEMWIDFVALRHCIKGYLNDNNVLWHRSNVSLNLCPSCFLRSFKV